MALLTVNKTLTYALYISQRALTRTAFGFCQVVETALLCLFNSSGSFPPVALLTFVGAELTGLYHLCRSVCKQKFGLQRPKFDPSKMTQVPK